MKNNNDAVDKDILKGIFLCKYIFKDKPLVVGGLALEYYGIRPNGEDFDYIVSPNDWNNLRTHYKDNINLVRGKTEKEVDLTINIVVDDKKVDLISSLYQFNYDELIKDSLEHDFYRVISIEKILFIKTLAAVNNDIKSIKDQKLIVDFIVDSKYQPVNR